MNHKGFTLIELMIVVAIIGILVAVGMPQYQNYVARAQVAEGLSMASSIKTAISEYFSINGKYPEGNQPAIHTALGIDTDPSTFAGSYVSRITLKKFGRFEILFSDAASELIAKKSFYMIPEDEGGSISWRCACRSASGVECEGEGGRPMLEKYLPSSCLLASNSDGGTDSLPLPTPEPDTDPVPWADAKTDDNACWSQAYAAGAGDGNGWIVGNTKIAAWKSYAKDMGLATNKWGVPTVANPVAADVSNYLCE